MLHVIDHTWPAWQARYKLINRENGAATYSRDIVTHHLPILERWASNSSVTVSTAPPLLDPQGRGDVLIQYLHEYRHKQPTAPAFRIKSANRHRYKRIVFVTAYEELSNLLRRSGIEAWYVPMGIDVDNVKSHADTIPYRRVRGKTAAYYGNLTRAKKPEYTRMLESLESCGWTVEHVVTKSSEAAWPTLSRYSYGIGVGRCALEMGSLGLRVMISGQAFGGLMLSEKDVQIQRATNMNGRKTTGVVNYIEACEKWGESLPGVTTDVKQATKVLEGYLA